MDTKRETISTQRETIGERLRELIHEGNVRKIIISDKEGKDIVIFPLAVGVVGTVLAPVIAAVGAIAALIGECSISIEKETKKGGE